MCVRERECACVSEREEGKERERQREGERKTEDCVTDRISLLKYASQ